MGQHPSSNRPLPHLRPGLRFIPVTRDGSLEFIVEDPLRRSYFRIGFEEYLVLTYLNHCSSPQELLQRVNREAERALTMEQLNTIFQWLGAHQLLQIESTQILDSILERKYQEKQLRRQNRFNLISFRIPLGNPDPFLRRIAPWLNWLTGPWFALAWLLAGVAAISVLSWNWNSFHAGISGFFSPLNILLIWGIWIFLKILHELFHALVCYRYGGHVHEAGILFILFMPLTYVNATSSWRFPSRWQRIHVAAAGIFAELGVAWAAILFWAHSPESMAGLIAHHTAIVAGFTSLLFNANPLMRFDGYYILSDLIGIPNLYQIGLSKTKQFFRWLFLGIKQEDTNDIPLAGFVSLYGFLVFFWRILVFCSLGYLASKLFGGLGIIITLGAILIWLSRFIQGLMQNWPLYNKLNPNVLRHLLIRSLAFSAIGLALFFTMGWQQSIRAPAVVEYVNQHRVRAGVAGFVDQIFIRDGQHVQEGQELIKLTNHELLTALEETRLFLKRIEIQCRLAQEQGDISLIQILQEQRKALEKKLKRQQEQAEALVVKSPGNGQVIASDLDRLQGTYLRKGQEILWVADTGNKQLVAAVSQEGIDALRALVGQYVTVDMRPCGIGIFKGSIKRISPKASVQVLHPGLAARYGGPVDVLERRVRHENGDHQEEIRLEFFEPRFFVEISVPEQLVERLWAGQTAIIHTQGPWLTLWDRAVRLVEGWIHRKDRATLQDT